MKFIRPKILLHSPYAEKALLLRLKLSKNRDHINDLILKHAPLHNDKIMDINVYVPYEKMNRIGKVIGKGGCKLKEIERMSNTHIRLRKNDKVYFNITKEAEGDVWMARDMINDVLGDKQRENEVREYSDWEKYYYWWYYYNVENKNKHR
ncbi:polyribonucleotide nucleotidyltransferase [Trachipleistophora hominis]|uniref:Polyribonucleotide nucleotidyltransferase n=1 Tax=Trachipleistophora hominis TaxID=72359 RepID=L7JXS2_TRAHO|nr:polyribonucleotide nucleotidyltransferase [Trachipleistophora hominis]